MSIALDLRSNRARGDQLHKIFLDRCSASSILVPLAWGKKKGNVVEVYLLNNFDTK
jgi:hypothetical protein